MADEPQPAPQPAPANWADVHPKVAAVAIAGILTTMLIPLAKRYGIDLSGQEANITALISVIAGYMMPSA